MAAHRKYMTTQMNMNLPVKLVERIDAYVSRSGKTKVGVVIDAVTEWLDKRAQELDSEI